MAHRLADENQSQSWPLILSFQTERGCLQRTSAGWRPHGGKRDDYILLALSLC